MNFRFFSPSTIRIESSIRGPVFRWNGLPNGRICPLASTVQYARDNKSRLYMIGDFDLEPSEAPLLQYVLDELLIHDDSIEGQQIPTRYDSGGIPGRHIGFMVRSSGADLGRNRFTHVPPRFTPALQRLGGFSDHVVEGYVVNIVSSQRFFDGLGELRLDSTLRKTN